MKMKNEIIKKRLIESKGKKIKVFLQNNFKYEGDCSNCDDYWLELRDYKTGNYMVFELTNIKVVEILS